MLITMSGRANSIVQFLTVFILFILVLALTYFTTRWIANYQKVKTVNKNIEIVETFRISQTKYVQIIKTGSKYLVIAVCKDTVTFLSELTEDEIDFTKADSVSTVSFKEILEKTKNFYSKK